MGVGDSLEAAAVLAGPIGAGTWHLVGDGIVFAPVDMSYDIIWRTSAGDTPIVSFHHHFDPQPVPPSQYTAELYEDDAVGERVPAVAGDKLVLRFSAAGPGGTTDAFAPNADGPGANGRIPSIHLP